MTPPSLMLVGHAIMLCAFAIATAPAINRWARRPRVWWLAAIGDTGVMTLYPWHMPALPLMHLGFHRLGLSRHPGQPNMLVMGMIQLTIVIVAAVTLFVALRPLENNPLGAWVGNTPVGCSVDAALCGIMRCVK